MWAPDDLDVRIIKAMASPASFQWDVRISYASVAKGLEVDEETVRSRLRRMNDVGFLQGWQLILNPVLLGREAALVEVRVGDVVTKSEAIERLSMLEGVTQIDDFYGRELAVHLLYPNDETLTRSVDLIASLCGSPKADWWRLGFPTCDLTPSQTDWRIFQALRSDARGRLSDVSRSLHLSTRTVKRRMKDLAEGNAFYLDPVLDVGKVGGVRCRYWVVCESERKRAVDEQILKGVRRIISTHTAPPEYSLFIVHFANASEVQETATFLKSLDGVKEVRSNIDVEHLHVQGWLLEEIARRITATAS